MGAHLYMLRCADGSYYVGTTRTSLDDRVAQHNAGDFGGYTAWLRPVILMFSNTSTYRRRHSGGEAAQGLATGQERGVDPRRLRSASRPIGELQGQSCNNASASFDKLRMRKIGEGP
jgi:GIY-YIG catalytic domain-containing protein